MGFRGGNPEVQAAPAHKTMAMSAAQRATRPSPPLPKSTILVMVTATDLLTRVMTRTPKIHERRHDQAVRGVIDLVETTVAMALGASVQPFTNTTLMVRMMVISSAGFPKRSSMNPIATSKLQEKGF